MAGRPQDEQAAPERVRQMGGRTQTAQETGAGEAEEAIRMLTQLAPNLRLEHVSGMLVINDATAMQRIVNGLRKTGFPEGHSSIRERLVTFIKVANDSLNPKSRSLTYRLIWDNNGY